MIKDNITVRDVCDLFNEIIQKDPECAKSLIDTRIICNKEIADHPTIQVLEENGETRVGLLGFINGMFGIGDDGMGPICVIINDDGLLERMVPMSDLPDREENDAEAR